MPTGLLNLEHLLRRFLISKETLSVRMLDDSQDPTPLLKEIRDDKTATIVVDANTTMSHIILERVSVHVCNSCSCYVDPPKKKTSTFSCSYISNKKFLPEAKILKVLK